MRVLLDTHVLLWAVLSPKALSRRAAAIIADERNEVLVSAASAWEIATKVRLGRLPGAEVLEREFLETMERAGYVLLPIDASTALRAGRLTSEHRDPFDRVLAAQALAEDIPLLSADSKLDSFGVRRMW
ncbi:MAG TPA: type II toxin-antitoxin system VapC family toxin [Acidobacteriaceae bacterium]|nr:type II toxin-antitoxin system VapC family toxin [Acidobacteriaceae bacterium]